ALRHDFPEAVIETGQFGQDPNRPFAARCFDVLHADFPVTHSDQMNYRFPAQSSRSLTRLPLRRSLTEPVL
ncbi:hypothetical protein R5H32_20505, partial [Defluviimonas sp. D31]|uniref:hypothetical protein n=1 Tax=Defluviimonas sp. D31 TaxID=3083253 RepID=UPI00296F4753